MTTTPETTAAPAIATPSVLTQTTSVVTSTLNQPVMSSVPSSSNLGSFTGAGGSSSTIVMPSAGHTAVYSLGMLAATFECFSGKEVKRYFEKVELRSRLDNLSEKDTLNVIKFKLLGEAYEYFKSDPNLYTLDYAGFKNKFIKRFSAIRLPGENQLNLSKCYQRHDEAVSAFCTRLRILGIRVLQEDLKSAADNEKAGLRKKNDELILNQFKLGLRRDFMKDIGVLLLKEDNLTLDKA